MVIARSKLQYFFKLYVYIEITLRPNQVLLRTLLVRA